VEEPFPPENLEQYAALRTTLGIPVAAGENEFGVQGFRELIASGAVDIVQPDTCRAGGITEVFRVGQMAAARGLRVATHTWSDAVALTANMHVVASLACGYGVEIDQTGNPFIDELLTERLRVTNGEVELPRKPGLGIELNQDTLSRYTVPRGECFPDGNYSDMVFGQAYYGPAPPWEMIGSARS
jgi:D-galactarolactone cycloisomerase